MIRSLLALIFVQLLLHSGYSYGQNQDDTLSVNTPFRKGRWLTGLSGSISSGSNSLDSLGSGINRNQYSLELGTGMFVKDRLLIGGIISLSRTNSEEFFKETTEVLFIGPVASWYLTDGLQGSLFVSLAPGYVKFRDESGFNQNGNLNSVIINGNGVGGLLSFGYSYVLHDRVAFDLSLSYSQSWIKADVIQQPSNITSIEDLSTGDLSFSFGFNVLLDKFFF